MEKFDVYEFANFWRDCSPPAFSVQNPQGAHAAWRFRILDTGAKYGPYMTRADAEGAARVLLEAEAEEARGVLWRALRRFFEDQGGEDQI